MGSPSDSISHAPDKARRFLLAIGTADYDNLPPKWQLPSVRQDLERITALFERLWANPVLSDGCNLTSGALIGAIEDWLKADQRAPSDILVLYFSGHGVSAEDETHYLYTRDTKEDRLESTAVATERLARTLAGSSVRQMLVLLDTCYSGEGADDLAAAAIKVVKRRPFDADELETGLWFVATARHTEEADEGAFAQALETAVDDERFGGPRLAYLDIGALVGAVNAELRRQGRRQRVYMNSVGVTGPCIALANPRYSGELPAGISVADQRRLLADLSHWDPRARGVVAEADAGWYFTGRHRALAELIAWLAESRPTQNLSVVTGGPGSGKSAVLSRLVTLSNPDYRARAPVEVFAEGPEVPEDLIDLAALAKGKTLANLVSELAASADVEATTPDGLVRALASRFERLTVVVDALDEATEPKRIINELLLPLARAIGQIGATHVLVGVRPHLLAAFGAAIKVLDLDRDEYLDHSDVARYVERYLLGEHRSSYRGRAGLAREAADAVATKSGRSFLIARVYAGMLANAPAPIDVKSSAWQQRPTELGDVLEEDLARLGPDVEWARELLRPLAYAEGAGLPWEDLWAPLATALTESKHNYDDVDVRRLLEVAGSYVVEAVKGRPFGVSAVPSGFRRPPSAT